METNRIDAIKEISRNLRDLVVDTTPASLTGSSIDALRLIHPNNNQLRGNPFYAYSCGGAEQSRIITEFLPAKNPMLLEQVFDTVPSTNTNFLVLDNWEKEEYDSAINRALGLARELYREDSVGTITIVGSQYEYAVPSGMTEIHTIRLVPSTNSDYRGDVEVRDVFEIPPHKWSILLKPTGSHVIAFDPRKIALSRINDQTAEIVGQQRVVVAGTDNAKIPEDIFDFVVEKASARMASQRIDESQEWQVKFRVFRDSAKLLEEHIFRPRRGKPVN